MSKTMNILFGFHIPKIQKQIEKSLKDRGYEVNGQVSVGKVAIMDFLRIHNEFNVCVLQERMADGSNFSSADLRKLTDERDINIVIIFDEERKGTTYMKEILAANILNGLFSSSKEPIFAPVIVDYILEPRTRKSARSYYGIPDDELVSPDSIDDSKYTEFLNYLDNNGNHNGIGERYLTVINGLTKAQNIKLIKMLPAHVRKDITRTKEYVRAKALIDAAKTRDAIITVEQSADPKQSTKKKVLKKMEELENSTSTEIATVDTVTAVADVSGNAELDTEEYVANLLRPFRDNRRVIGERERRAVPLSEKEVFRQQLDRILNDELLVNKRAKEKRIESTAEPERAQTVAETPLENGSFVASATDGEAVEPMSETPVMKEPVMKEPVIEEPVIEEPVIEEPVIEEPVTDNMDTEAENEPNSFAVTSI